MAAELHEPKPKERSSHYKPYCWPDGAEVCLESAPSELPVNLTRLAQERQSRRAFTTLPLPALGHLLSLCCRANSWAETTFGFEQQFRGVPSAGAIHPIHVLVQRERSEAWERYDPIGHKLKGMGTGESKASAGSARAFADELVVTGAATLVALVAEPGKTGAKYNHPESLVWRDAGVLIGAMAWTAEALGLNLCPLGTTGHTYVAPLGPEGVFVGMGMLLIGGRPAHTH